MAAPLLLGLVASAAHAGPPALGAEVPAFALQGSDGRSYTLEQFVGKRGVVLAWFPKAFTPG